MDLTSYASIFSHCRAIYSIIGCSSYLLLYAKHSGEEKKHRHNEYKLSWYKVSEFSKLNAKFSVKVLKHFELPALN